MARTLGLSVVKFNNITEYELAFIRDNNTGEIRYAGYPGVEEDIRVQEPSLFTVIDDVKLQVLMKSGQEIDNYEAYELARRVDIDTFKDGETDATLQLIHLEDIPNAVYNGEETVGRDVFMHMANVNVESNETLLLTRIQIEEYEEKGEPQLNYRLTDTYILEWDKRKDKYEKAQVLASNLEEDVQGAVEYFIDDIVDVLGDILQCRLAYLATRYSEETGQNMEVVLPNE